MARLTRRTNTADGEPAIARPIPRRPGSQLQNELPQDVSRRKEGGEGGEGDRDDGDNHKRARSPPEEDVIAKMRQELHKTGLAPDPRLRVDSPLPRSSSYQDLTSSTLSGVFSNVTTDKLFGFVEGKERHSPWGTGAGSPVKRSEGLDEGLFQLMRRRSKAMPPLTRSRITTRQWASSLGVRAALLFALGLGYGELITRFRSQEPRPIGGRGGERVHLIVWGLTAMVLGALTPWFDEFWDSLVRAELDREEHDQEQIDRLGRRKSVMEAPRTDGALVLRVVGIFAGIAYGIRKLAWTSTTQLSVALAAANPLLWWVIDRTAPGLIICTCSSLVGSVLLFTLDPDMLPIPDISLVGPGGNAPVGASPSPSPLLYGLVDQESLETWLWMLSFLFCSSMCFVNIGRRVAWGEAAAVRGRWGVTR